MEAEVQNRYSEIHVFCKWMYCRTVVIKIP